MKYILLNLKMWILSHNLSGLMIINIITFQLLNYKEAFTQSCELSIYITFDSYLDIELNHHHCTTTSPMYPVSFSGSDGRSFPVTIFTFAFTTSTAGFLCHHSQHYQLIEQR